MELFKTWFNTSKKKDNDSKVIRTSVNLKNVLERQPNSWIRKRSPR